MSVRRAGMAIADPVGGMVRGGAARLAARLAIIALCLGLSFAAADADWVPAGLAESRIRAVLESASGARFACTSGGLFRSLDGGTTWTSIQPLLFADAFSAVVSPDSNHLFIAVESGVYRSGDDGASWMSLGDAIAGTYSLAIAPNHDVYASGALGTWRSTDRGLSWSQVHEAAGSFTDGIAIDPDGRIFLKSIFLELVRSTDQGSSWDTLTPSDEFMPALAVSPRTGTVLVGTMSFDPPTMLSVYRSADHGDTWQRVVHRAGGIDAVQFLSNGDALAGADNVLHSTDDGRTWTPRNTGLPFETQVDCFAQVHGQVFAGTRQAGLWREENLAASSPQHSPRAASGLRLSVTPSPFRLRTRLYFELPAAGRVRLEVFAVHGERVARVADGEFAAGPHVVPLDARGLPAGIYFARLAAGAGVVSVPILFLK